MCEAEVGDLRTRQRKELQVLHPSKVGDARYQAYVDEYGEEAWELDALEPTVLRDLVRTHVLAYRDEEKWEAKVEEEKHERSKLAAVSEKWEELELE